MVGTALAWRDGSMDTAAAVLCLGFALLIQIGTNFANDYYDFVKGADTAARVGPRRAVAAGLIAPTTMRRAMWMMFATAFVCGLGLIAWGGPWLLVIGVASILCGIAYTGGPWPLGYHGLGDVFVFLFFGLVAVGATYFVQTGNVSNDALLAGRADRAVGGEYPGREQLSRRRDGRGGGQAYARRAIRKTRRTGSARAVPPDCVRHVPVWMAVVIEARGFVAADRAPLAWAHVRRCTIQRRLRSSSLLLGDTGKLLAMYALLLSAGLVLG